MWIDNRVYLMITPFPPAKWNRSASSTFIISQRGPWFTVSVPCFDYWSIYDPRVPDVWFLSFLLSLFLSFFNSSLFTLSFSLSLSVWAVWMSSYIISMPLAVIIDSFCRSCPPPSRSLTRNSEEICELYHLQRSSFLLRIPTGSALSSPPDLF